RARRGQRSPARPVPRRPWPGPLPSRCPRRRTPSSSPRASRCRAAASAGSARPSGPDPCCCHTPRTSTRMISVRCARAARGDLTVRSRHRANSARADRPEWGIVSQPHAKIVILGGGPGGYEAALVAAQLGADVTIVDSDGIGGACVLTDCVPSKTLIETSNAMTLLNRSAGLGIATGGLATVNAARLYERIIDLARAQSADITARLAAEGIKGIKAKGRLAGPQNPGVVQAGPSEIRADAVLTATRALPRVLPGAPPDGERILTWRQLYDLTELPRDLIVIGSGVTGAEFASAYQALGARVTLAS